MSDLNVISLVGENDSTPEDAVEVVKFDQDWFKIWWISISIIFVFEMFLRKRQLNMYYTRHRPDDIKHLVTKDDFRKCQKYSKAKM